MIIRHIIHNRNNQLSISVNWECTMLRTILFPALNVAKVFVFIFRPAPGVSWCYRLLDWCTNLVVNMEDGYVQNIIFRQNYILFLEVYVNIKEDYVVAKSIHISY